VVITASECINEVAIAKAETYPSSVTFKESSAAALAFARSLTIKEF
jgi:hypothetical protein